MTKAHVRPARWDDIPTLAENMRAADVAEIKAASGLSAEEALQIGVRSGALVGCRPDDTPVMIYGVIPGHTPDVGAVWMLATDGLLEFSRQFLRESREAVAKLCEGYRLVYNFTDARNTAHHRWIKWAGFTIIKRHEEFGVEKRPFLEFVRITEGHHV